MHTIPIDFHCADKKKKRVNVLMFYFKLIIDAKMQNSASLCEYWAN